MFKTKSEEKLFKELYAKLRNDFERKMKQTEGSNRKTDKEIDRIKFQRLVAEYKNFKRNNVQHYRFNSASNSNHTAFGQFQTLRK